MSATSPLSRRMPVPWTRFGLAAGIAAMPLSLLAWTGASGVLLCVLFALDVSTLGAAVFSLCRCALALNRRAWRWALLEAGMALLMLAASASPLVWFAVFWGLDGD